MYYVFSFYYETLRQYRYGDFYYKSKTYPKKSYLKKIIKDKFVDAENIVILGITQMTERDLNLYWD